MPKGVKVPASFFSSPRWREPRTFSEAEAELDLLRRRQNDLTESPSRLALEWNWSKWKVLRFMRAAPQPHRSRTKKKQQKQATEARPRTESAPQPHQEMPDFDLFWDAYPRKVGKGAARRSWLSSNGNRPAMSTLLSALEQQKRSEQWTKDSGQYIPHPSTWLNQERWDDLVTSTTSSKSRRASSWRR